MPHIRGFAHLPIIAMTANDMQEEGQKILEAGMNAHLTKPVNAGTMLQTIQLLANKSGCFVQQQKSRASCKSPECCHSGRL